MKELNTILTKDTNDLLWEEILLIIKSSNNIYSESDLSLYKKVDSEFYINRNQNYKLIFEAIQPLVEDNVEHEDVKVNVVDNLTNLLSFLKVVSDLDKHTYETFRDSIYFEFITLIGKFYLENLILKLKIS